jgi:hypothetical protein
MKNNFDDKLAKKFRDSLENYPVAYESGAWEQFEKYYLKKLPMRTIPLRQRYAVRIAVSALILLVATLGYFYYWQPNNNSPIKPFVANQPAKKPQPAAITQLPAPSNIQNIIANAPTNRKKQNKNIQNFENQIVKTIKATSKPAKDTDNPSALNAALIESASIHPTLTNNDILTESKPVMIHQLPLLPFLIANSFNRQLAIHTIAEAALFEPSNTQQATVIKLLPGMQFASGIVGGSSVESPVAFYGAGASVDLFLQKKLALAANLQLVQTAYETPQQRFRVFNNLRRDSIGTLQLVPVFAEETQYSHIRLNLIQIPLTIKYLSGKNFFLNIGGVSYIATNRTMVSKVARNSLMGQLHSPPSSVESALQPFRTLYLGGGIRIPLKNGILQAEPHVSLPLGNVLQNVNNTSLQWIGLNLGIYYGQ